jgi:hypothetical protein
VSRPEDSAEREADRIAETVTRPEPADDRAVAPAAAGARPLDAGIRRKLEPAFGTDFSQVQVHTDAQASADAGQLDAQAFTVGRDISFAAGAYAPHTTPGQRLIAHELAHVVRRDSGTVFRQTQPPPPAGGGAPPARVVYLDANIIIQINRGNQPVAQSLRTMRASGVEVLIPPYQYGELVNNPDIPRTATAQRLMLEEMNIKVGAAPEMAQRVDVNIAGQTAAGGNIMQLTDQQLVASAKADGRNVEIWSLDTPFTSNPGQVESTYGVRIAPESQLAPVQGRPDYRVGRQLLGLAPVEISLTGQVSRGGGGGVPPAGVPPGGAPAPPSPSGGGTAGTSYGTGTKIVAGGMAVLIVVSEILGSVARVHSIQQYNIDVGEAQLAFWERFGARPVRGVWDQNDRHPLPAGTKPETSLFGSPSFPYVVDIDIGALNANLPQRIDSYQDFLYFLDAAKTLSTIEEDPQMPQYPTPAQKAESRRYYAWVNNPDREHRRVYDITDLIERIRRAALAELDVAMREHTAALPATERANIYRLRIGAETPVYRSAGGGQRILTAQQIFGPDPWVRTIGARKDVGGWFTTDVRALVVPANTDAQRASLVSGYWVKQRIEDTYDEVRKGGREILERQPAEGPLNSFVAGPEPGAQSRFGQTRYYRPADPDVIWTIAIGELREFWVKAGDLVPVPEEEVSRYAAGH